MARQRLPLKVIALLGQRRKRLKQRLVIGNYPLQRYVPSAVSRSRRSEATPWCVLVAAGWHKSGRRIGRGSYYENICHDHFLYLDSNNLYIDLAWQEGIKMKDRLLEAFTLVWFIGIFMLLVVGAIKGVLS